MEKDKLDKNREDFVLYVLGKVNTENKHYNQYIHAQHLGLLYLYVGHHGNWEYNWMSWDDINGDYIIDYLNEQRLNDIYVKALRSAGCKCTKPLLGYRPGVGPRCRLCNTIAELTVRY